MYSCRPSIRISIGIWIKIVTAETGGSHETLYRTLAELEEQGRIGRGNGVIASPDASAGQDNTPDDEFSRR
jgi:DeoR/GlpR family transcriptional regulator of sugar metabolism